MASRERFRAALLRDVAFGIETIGEGSNYRYRDGNGAHCCFRVGEAKRS